MQLKFNSKIFLIVKTVEPILAAIANNFITERNNSEVIAVGLNAIREISSRCPLAMNEDLLGDLVQYKTYKDKGVSSAAKSLIQLFREKNPHMLHKRMRGKPTEAVYEEMGKIKTYGEIDAKNFIAGAEIIDFLDNEKNKLYSQSINNVDQIDEWEECSDNEKVNADGKIKKRKYSTDGDDDNDEDDEWVVVTSEDEIIDKKETEDVLNTSKLTLEEKEQRAMKISSEKIFTQEDFKKIRQEQLKKKINDKNFVKSNDKIRKKNISIETDSETEEVSRAKR